MSRLIGTIYAFAAIAIIVALSACNPFLTAQSPAPPGRVARLDPVMGVWAVKSYRIELSRGVALALTCTDDGPCEHVTVVSENPAIAEVRPASLSLLQSSAIASEATSAAVVVVGKSPGTTKLHLTTKRGSRDIAVTIVAPPT